MPVLFCLNDIPERILYKFLKANLYPHGEIPVIVPVYRRLGFVSLPDEGFFVTDKRIVIYETRILVGLAKNSEFMLSQVIDCNFSKCDNGHEFRFVLNDGTQYMVKINLPANECKIIQERSIELIKSVKNL